MELVKALYDPQSALPNDKKYYENAILGIELDGISSQVYFLLKEQGRLDQTPSFFQARLKETYEKGLYQNLFIKNQMNLILKEFEDERLDVIALKGVNFAEKYFGHIGARITSDIDLLIRLEDLEKAIDIAKSLGFLLEKEVIPGYFHCSLSKELPHSKIPLVVELHWSLIKEHTSKFSAEDIWNKSTLVGQFSYIKELSPQHTFYMILLHGWRHNLDSLKYFLDIIQVIYQMDDEHDYEILLKLAKSHQTLKRITRTLSIVYQQFPYLDHVKKFPNKRATISWEFSSSKGLKQLIKFIDYKFFSFDMAKHSLIELFRWIWPSKMDAYSQSGEDYQGPSVFKLYPLLYKKRFTKLIEARRLKSLRSGNREE
ncbi:nucleotidyltransferase family protein [Neobacillus novalis]|uniref:Nucleotidyltransferase family protein n=1 Tax=Neobacillus novalis TaxID=220687 RepID=A0AA95MWS2_9BACI|nr:nucleotidyltransferase family protein [Neobacillus novalis]WHY89108.1 nucleotidyltransferase family protein [Neobacillus novalis]